MNGSQLHETLRNALLDRVGGFFRNTVRHSGETCSVCTGPVFSSDSARCGVCSSHRAEFGDQLADQVLPLTYVCGNRPQGIHQSAHTVVSYKRTPVAEKSVEDLCLMIMTATTIHASCIAVSPGRAWQAVTFVPSANNPGRGHPVARLARQVAFHNDANKRLTLDLGPGIESGQLRCAMTVSPFPSITVIVWRASTSCWSMTPGPRERKHSPLRSPSRRPVPLTSLCSVRPGGAATSGRATVRCSTVAPSRTTRTFVR
ncbi:hypothetical protein SAMN04487819_11819 [Actinopolyspora alba]|uniref:Uncharacterized protein n=1 Tax=Actinopolyspora alba TaxID=673379 RepID=A0A1I2BXN5_9ACTN|nr:hypothetical protein SAMN04487819_11819 [Actinopolyspora alba]